MNFKKLIFAAMAMVAVVTSCQKKEADGVNLEVDKPVVELEATEGSVQVHITADCSWSARFDADWLVVTPAKGTGNATVTISALANAGVNREAVVKFQKSTTAKVFCDVTVKQVGEKGEDGAEEISIAEFIQKGDTTNEYIVEGTVVSVDANATGTYKAITITDGTNTLCVFQPTNFDDFKDILKAGYTIKVKGKYEWYESKKLHELVKGTILSYAEGEEVQPINGTVAEFLAAANPNQPYRLTGEVTGFNATYCSFDLKDDTGSVYVYSVSDASKTQYASVLANGKKVTLVGSYYYYEHATDPSKNKVEITKAEIESVADGETPQELTTSKISEVIAAADNTKVILENVVVVATTKQAYLVKDAESKYILVYESANPAETLPAVGDKVKVTATKSSYSSMAQLGTPSTEKVGTETVTHPSATDISSSFDSFESAEVKYVSFKGTLAISGNYYNVTVDGASTKMGSISYPTQDLSSFASVPGCTYTGYYIYSTSNAKYVNIILTEVKAGEGKYLTVSPATSNVAASATTVALTVAANCAWTASSDNAAFALDKTSGENGATVNVTFAANETENEKVANITFTYDGGKTATAKITQAGKPSGNALTITAVFDKQGVYGIKGTSAAKTKDSEEFTVDGYTFVLAGDGTNGCASYDGYVLFGKAGAYIQSPAVADYKLKSITILTGANASTQVQVGVKDAAGNFVGGGDAITLNAKATEFTYNLSGTAANTAYRLQVVSAHNAQAQKLVLVYEK